MMHCGILINMPYKVSGQYFNDAPWVGSLVLVINASNLNSVAALLSWLEFTHKSQSWRVLRQ